MDIRAQLLLSLNKDKQLISTLKTDDDRIKFVLRYLQEHKSTHELVKSVEKNKAASENYRREANDLYNKKLKTGEKLQLDSIIEIYTKSIAYAPPMSPELALAYASRSAALFTAKLFDDCLRDIERALKHDYPDESKEKLFNRIARCLIAMNSNLSSQKAREKRRDWLKNMNLKDAEISIVENILTISSKNQTSIGKPRKLLDDERYKPEFVGVSSAMKLNYTEEFGRHYIATRDIKPGEVLLVEPLYASVLKINQHYKECENCQRQTWSGIPCDYCVQVIYCSQKCRDDAWSDHHDVECQVIGPLETSNMGFTDMMALRLTVRAIKEAGSLLALKEKIIALDSIKDSKSRVVTEDILDSSNYASVYILGTHTNERSMEDLFDCAIRSSYTVYLLATRSMIFKDQLTSSDIESLVNNEWAIFIGRLIMQHEQIDTTNTCELGRIDDELEMHARAVMVPRFCFFNHSCVPTVSKLWIGRSLIVIATNYIKHGDQIFDCYLMSYADLPKAERQARLRKSWYLDCRCIACRENWPLFQDQPFFIPPNHVRDKFNRVWMAIGKLDIAALIGDVKNPSKIIAELENFIEYTLLHVKHPQRQMTMMRNTFLTAWEILRSNRWQSLD